MAGKIIAGIKDQKFIIIIIISTIIIICGMLFLNDVVVSIRLLELKSFLRDIDKKASDMSTVGMVSKFKLYKKLYENKINEDILNKQEYTGTYNSLNTEDRTNIVVTKYKEIAPPVLIVMNLIRIFLQKPPVEYILTNKENYRLTLAYYTERLKKYDEALEIYDDLLDRKEVEESQIHMILLHQGYCLSIIGEYEKAKEKYLEIIKNFENEEVAITAARLLRFIEELEAEVRKVKESDDSPLLKSEKLYKLIAFKEALEILDKVIEEENEDKVPDKLQYLRARCYEETGEKEVSITLYQDIVEESIEQKKYDSETAKQANRRILLISTTEPEGDKIKELSVKNNALISDPDFSGLLDTASKLETGFKQEETKIEELKEEEERGGPTPAVVSGSIESYPEEIDVKMSKEEKAEAAVEEEQFKEFLNDSLKNVKDKIDKLVEEQSITPGPTPSPTPVPTPTKMRKQSTPIPQKTPELTPQTGPYNVTHVDEQGKLVKVEQFGEKGTLIKVKEFNDKGKITKVEQYDEVTGKMIGYFMYEFDEDGNPIKIYAYDQDGNIIKGD